MSNLDQPARRIETVDEIILARVFRRLLKQAYIQIDEPFTGRFVVDGEVGDLTEREAETIDRVFQWDGVSYRSVDESES